MSARLLGGIAIEPYPDCGIGLVIDASRRFPGRRQQAFEKIPSSRRVRFYLDNLDKIELVLNPRTSAVVEFAFLPHVPPAQPSI